MSGATKPSPAWSDALRSGLVKCARRMPGESVTLTDDEIRELVTDQWRVGADEALAQVNTATVKRLREERANMIHILTSVAPVLDAYGESSWFHCIDDLLRKMEREK